MSKTIVPSLFTQKVWQLALSIPYGRVTTYGYLTVAAGGHPMMAQMITTILSRSTNVDRIPFHRIVYAGGRVWLDDKHRKDRLKLYKSENINIDKNNKIINFEEIVYTFS
ncbi:MAG: MGMT family protein [Microgenomates group bacterium]